MSAIEPQNYEAFTLGDKFAWVHGQPGTRAVEAAADSVRTMGQRLTAITDAAGTDVRGLGVSWVGPASDAAQHSSKQIVDRAAQTRSLADNGADRILDYGHSFDEMRKKIAFEDPRQLSWAQMSVEPAKYTWDLWTGGQDHVSIITRNQQYDAAANDALRWHEANARAADDGFLTAGTDPPAAPGAGGGAGEGLGGRNGGGGDVPAAAPPPVAAAATAPAAPPSVAAPSGPPTVPSATGGAQVPAGGPAVPLPGATGPGTGRAGGGTGGAGTGAGPGRGAGAGRDAAGRPEPAGGRADVGSTGPAGAPSAAEQRRQRDFQNDLIRNSPYDSGRAPGTTTGPGTLPYGTGGRATPGPGPGAGGGWGYRSPDGRTALPGDGGARAGAGGWRAGSVGGYGGPGGYGGTGRYGSTGEPTSRLPGEPGARSWSRVPGESLPARPVAGEPAVGGRTGSGYGPGYAPMMGGAGGGRGDGDPHRNRYLLPSSEPFDVDLPYSPPVLAPEEDG